MPRWLQGGQRWTPLGGHVKSMIIGEGHALYEAFGGIHHIYSLAGYRAGRFPDGATRRSRWSATRRP